jgi:hypothetical protein
MSKSNDKYSIDDVLKFVSKIPTLTVRGNRNGYMVEYNGAGSLQQRHYHINRLNSDDLFRWLKYVYVADYKRMPSKDEMHNKFETLTWP